MIGNVGDAVVDNVSDYLKPIIEGRISDIRDRFGDFWNRTN